MKRNGVEWRLSDKKMTRNEDEMKEGGHGKVLDGLSTVSSFGVHRSSCTLRSSM